MTRPRTQAFNWRFRAVLVLVVAAGLACSALAGGGEACPPEHVELPVVFAGVLEGEVDQVLGCVPLEALRDVCNPRPVDALAAAAELVEADPVDCPDACKRGVVNLLEAIAALRARVDDHEARFHPGLPSSGRLETVLVPGADP